MSSVLVCGSARRLVQPDRAVVRMSVTAVANEAATALAQVSTGSNALAGVLDSLGIERSAWVTDGVSVADEWEWRKDTNVLVGQRATTGVTVTLANPAQLADVLGRSVTQAGAKVGGISWQVDADNPVHHELLGLAAADARRRAQAYATALDLVLGAVELISEAPISVAPEPIAPMPMMRAMKASADASEMSVSGGQIELAAQVHVRFAVLTAR
jgi:uncharacterized protein YggE